MAESKPHIATFTMCDPAHSYGYRYLRQCWSVVDGRMTDVHVEGSNDMESWVRINAETLH